MPFHWVFAGCYARLGKSGDRWYLRLAIDGEVYSIDVRQLEDVLEHERESAVVFRMVPGRKLKIFKRQNNKS
jgi:hypothetical protein